MKSIPSSNPHRNWLALGTQTFSLIALALLPKCPLCVGLYLGFAAAFGVDTLAVARWSSSLLIVSGLLVLVKMLRVGIRFGRLTGFWLGLAGFAAILASRFGYDSAALRASGLLFFCAGCIDSLTHCAAARKACALVSSDCQ